MADRITTDAANENVLSPDGRTLYVIGTDGRVRAYDVASRALLNTWTVGTRLGGADVTADGRYLVVVEREPVSSTLDQSGNRSFVWTVHRLDLQTGAVRNYDYADSSDFSARYDGAFFDVAILADGRALLSRSFNGSGWVNLRTLNLDTGTYTTLSGSVRQDSVLSLSDDRRLILIGEPNISSAEMELYRLETNGTIASVAQTPFGSGFNRGIQDISGDGRLVANFVPGAGLLIFDGQLRFVRNLANDVPSWQNGRVEGVAFDEAGRYLYVLDGDRKQIVQLSTDGWSQVATFALDPSYTTDLSASGRFGNNLTLTDDGRFLIVQTSTGVQRVSTAEAAPVIRGTAGDDRLVGTADGERIEGLAGADVIDGQGGADVLVGGAGTDTFLFTTASSATNATIGRIEGGGDADTLDLRAVGPIILSTVFEFDPNRPGQSNVLQVRIGGQSYNVLGVETILLGDGEQTVLATYPSEPITIRAGGGNDRVTATVATSVYGESGDDTFELASGTFGSQPRTSVVDGGAGSDTLILFDPNGVRIDLGAGTVTGGGYDYTVASIETVRVRIGFGTVTMLGTDAGETLAVDRQTSVFSSPGGATIDGRGGNDVLLGGPGADLITGGTGNDRLDGGEGVDTALFSGTRAASSIARVAGGGIRVSGANGTDALTNVERLQFDDGVFDIPALSAAPTLAVRNFGASAAAGGWENQAVTARTLADVNGDGRADIVGFGYAGTYVALANADGTFGDARLAIANFGVGRGAGGWENGDRYPRVLADVNGDGRADIVGFGETATYVALGNADGTFSAAFTAVANFGAGAAGGGWGSQNTYQRALADVNGDGRADIVGFGFSGTYVALANANGTFGEGRLVLANFGAGRPAGGWDSQSLFPRMLGDVNGDGRADIVAFGQEATYTALATADGGFAPAALATGEFGRREAAGGWTSQERHTRRVADVNGDNLDDIIGFGERGAYVALANGTGGFNPSQLASTAFGAGDAAGGWRNDNLYPRMAADVNGDGLADLVGFGDGGVSLLLTVASVPIA